MTNNHSPRFQKVYIEISNICNLQCSFCPEVVRSKKLISTDLFRRIVQQVAPLTEQIAFHLMGDPLVHPQLPELVKICGEYKAKIFFVTNGVLLKEPQSELLLDPAFRQVNFSLHSFTDNFPERDPSAYLERIFAYSERALEARPDLYLNYRLWNMQEARGSAEGDRDLLRRIGERFQVEVPQSVDVRRKKSHPLKGRLYLHFDTEFTWPDLHAPVIGTQGRCHGLSTHFGILVDGTVVPCCLDKEGAIPLGNVNEKSVEEILAAPRALKILNGFRARQLVEDLCQRCQYIERFKPHQVEKTVTSSPSTKKVPGSFLPAPGVNPAGQASHYEISQPDSILGAGGECNRATRRPHPLYGVASRGHAPCLEARQRSMFKLPINALPQLGIP